MYSHHELVGGQLLGVQPYYCRGPTGWSSNVYDIDNVQNVPSWSLLIVLTTNYVVIDRATIPTTPINRFTSNIKVVRGVKKKTGKTWIKKTKPPQTDTVAHVSNVTPLPGLNTPPCLEMSYLSRD